MKLAGWRYNIWPWPWVLLLVAPAAGQTDQPGRHLLTLGAALQRSLANPVRTSPEVLAIQAATAQLEALPSPLSANPEFRLTHVDRWDDASEHEYALRLRTTNPWLAKAKTRTQGHSVELARTQLASRKHEILHHTKVLYFAALFAQENRKLAEDWKLTTQRHLEWHEKLLEGGHMTLPDVLEVQLGASEAARDAREATLDFQLALNSLLSWIDKLDTTATRTVLSTPFQEPTENLLSATAETLARQYMEGHPLPKAFEGQNSITGSILDEAEEAKKPWISFLQAGMSRGQNSWEGEDWRLRLGVEIPFFSQKDKEIQVAEARHAHTRAQLNAHLHEASLQIKGKHAGVQHAARHLKQTQGLSEGILKEVLDTLAEDKASDMQTIPPDSKFRLERGVHRIQSAILEAQYAQQEALLGLEYFLPSETLE